MNNSEIIDRLINNKIPVPIKIAHTLIEIGETREIGTKQNVLEIGQKCKEIFFVLEGGFINQFSNFKTGDIRTISFHLPDFQPWVSSADSFFYNATNKFQLRSIKASYVLVIKKEEIDKMIATNPAFQTWLLETVKISFIDQFDILSHHITLSSKEMYLHMLKEQSQVVKQVPAKYIAEFLGITREHFSRIRKSI